MTRLERLKGGRSGENRDPEEEIKKMWPKWGRGSSHMGEPRPPRKLFGGVPPDAEITGLDDDEPAPLPPPKKTQKREPFFPR
jgi:hypothetical protein